MNRSGQRPKNGPARPYTVAEIEYFATFGEHRAPYTPQQCDRGGAAGLCWAVMGPPAVSSHGQCLGCGGTPRAPARKAAPPQKKYPGHF